MQEINHALPGHRSCYGQTDLDRDERRDLLVYRDQHNSHSTNHQHGFADTATRRRWLLRTFSFSWANQQIHIRSISATRAHRHRSDTQQIHHRSAYTESAMHQAARAPEIFQAFQYQQLITIPQKSPAELKTIPGYFSMTDVLAKVICMNGEL